MNFITLINHTPVSFPLTEPRWPRPPGGGAREWHEFWYGNRERHRFRLEVRLRGPLTWIFRFLHRRNPVVCYIFLNGKVNEMTFAGTLAGSQYWYYDSPDHCTPRYQYKFIARYPFFGRSTATLPSASNLLSVRVLQFGEVSWFIPGIDPSAQSDQNETLYFSNNNKHEHIYVQNLSENRVSADLSVIRGNAETFKIASNPNPVDTLNCGDIVSFVVSFDHHLTTATEVIPEGANCRLNVLDVVSGEEILTVTFSLWGILEGE